jgi:hypothetical protein
MAIATCPGLGHPGEVQDADDLLAALEGHAQGGGERFGLPVRRPSLPVAVIVHSQQCAALQHLAGEPLSGRQAYAGAVPRVAATDDQFEVASLLINEIDTPRPDTQQAAAPLHDAPQDFVKFQLSGNRQGDFPQRLQFLTPALDFLLRPLALGDVGVDSDYPDELTPHQDRGPCQEDIHGRTIFPITDGLPGKHIIPTHDDLRKTDRLLKGIGIGDQGVNILAKHLLP